ncbi:MAG: magnesium transporter [Patescibacteria group bacterium]|jgi:magnesium transporter
MQEKQDPIYADDDYESVGLLFRLRAPALIIGLFLGIIISFVTSNFEKVLEKDFQVAYFIPFIVYIADAIGSQTTAIYSRDLKSGTTKLGNYMKKEFLLGLLFGTAFGVVSGFVTYLWLHNYLLSITIAISAVLAITTAPLVALVVATLFQRSHRDPAAGTAPIATVLQDILSVVIYGTVASIIIL